MKQLTVSVIQFKLKEESDWEHGIVINDDMVIVDMEGKVIIGEIWNFIKKPYEGFMVVKVEDK